jgi:hypothetical protein
MDKQLLSISEFAQAVGIGQTLAKKLVRGGEVISVLIGHRRLIPVREVEVYVQSLISEAKAEREAAKIQDQTLGLLSRRHRNGPR